MKGISKGIGTRGMKNEVPAKNKIAEKGWPAAPPRDTPAPLTLLLDRSITYLPAPRPARTPPTHDALHMLQGDHYNDLLCCHLMRN
ncbi:hypothetical protein E2C01_058854 [Portunus trituberculatus]|uniref:Uncharacterized protein n=1 Tax=Portunus trituberculatus TaxID=210409 RepID=A0A5B7H5B1_PORTR|nr:hypothetical protein [Portunus trituberculatus]